MFCLFVFFFFLQLTQVSRHRYALNTFVRKINFMFYVGTDCVGSYIMSVNFNYKNKSP